MGTKLKAPLNLPIQYVIWCMGAFRGPLNWMPMIPRDASLSDSYKFDRCCHTLYYEYITTNYWFKYKPIKSCTAFRSITYAIISIQEHNLCNHQHWNPTRGHVLGEAWLDGRHRSDYSFSRGKHLLTSWAPKWRSLETAVHFITIVLRYLMRALNWSPIMPRDASLSDSQCKFFKFGWEVPEIKINRIHEICITNTDVFSLVINITCGEDCFAR